MTRQKQIERIERRIGKVSLDIHTGNVFVKDHGFTKRFTSVNSAYVYYFVNN